MSWRNFGALAAIPSADCSRVSPVSSLSTGQKEGTNEAIPRFGFLSQLQDGFMKGYLKGSSIRPSKRTTPLMSSSVGLTHSQAASSGLEAGDVQPGRRYAENQSGDGLPRCVPDCRD